MLTKLWQWLRRWWQRAPIPHEAIDITWPVQSGDIPAGTQVEVVEITPGPRTGEKHDFTYHHLRKDIADVAYNILERFEKLTRKNQDMDYDVSHDLLEEMWGCDFLVWNREIGERMKGGDKWSAVDHEGVEDELADLIWPIDFCVAEQEENYIRLYRIVTVTPQQVRGKVVRVMPKMVRYIMGGMHDDGRWHFVDGYAGLAGKRWTLLKNYKRMPGPDKDARHELVCRIMSSAFTARYEWHVALGTVPGGPRILLPTNPSGALQLFKNRAIPVGKTRREVLKHWVEEHWRENINDLAYVAHHLRGKTKFDWSDFGCELFPSIYDLEKNEFFKQQAKEWRAARKHNRVRVHIKKRA